MTRDKRHIAFAFECEALAFSALCGGVSNLDRMRLMARVLREFRTEADACDAVLAFCETSVANSKQAGADLRRFAESWLALPSRGTEYAWQTRADLQ